MKAACIILAVIALIGSIAYVCARGFHSRPYSCAILSKQYVPSTTTWVWVSHGKGGHLQPMIHPERWILVVRRSDGVITTRDVDSAIWGACEVGTETNLSFVEWEWQ